LCMTCPPWPGICHVYVNSHLRFYEISAHVSVTCIDMGIVFVM
jgi:hypothetical protein